MTKVSDLLQREITRNDLISILGLDVSARTISKARRGSQTARERIGWDNEIELDEAKKEALFNAEGNMKHQALKRANERQYWDALAALKHAHGKEQELVDLVSAGKDLTDEYREAVKITKAAKVVCIRLLNKIGGKLPRKVQKRDELLRNERKRLKDALQSETESDGEAGQNSGSGSEVGGRSRKESQTVDC